MDLGVKKSSDWNMAPDTSIASENRTYLDALQKQIAGKENLPAKMVFKNIKIMTSSARRLLSIKNIAYSRSLGVRCTHCHVPYEWESEDKPTKQIARDMSAMMKVINSQLLENIKNLQGRSPGINCTTCHRGQTKPALDLADSP